MHLSLAVNEQKIPVQGGACRMEEQANLGVIIPDNAQRSVGAPSDGERGFAPASSLCLPSFQGMQPSQSEEQERVSLIRASITSAMMRRLGFDLCLK